MSTFDALIREVVMRSGGSKAERAELMEELRSHLENAKADYINLGYMEADAIELAIRDFGDSTKIGRELASSMFPFRRGLLLVVGIGLLVYSNAAYLFIAANYFENHAVWLTIMTLLGISITLIGMYPSFAADRKLITNCLLAFSIFITQMGIDADHWVLRLLGLVLISASAALIFMIALQANQLKKLHLAYLILGAIILEVVVFTTPLIIWMTSTVRNSEVYALIPSLVAIAWAIMYWLHYKSQQQNLWRSK